VVCGQPRFGTAAFEQVGQLAVQGATPWPVRIGVERFPDEVVPERRDPRLDFVEQASVEDLAQAAVAAQLCEQLELNLDTDDSCCLEGVSSLV
jgi:hypothetical protein